MIEGLGFVDIVSCFGGSSVTEIVRVFAKSSSSNTDFIFSIAFDLFQSHLSKVVMLESVVGFLGIPRLINRMTKSTFSSRFLTMTSPNGDCTRGALTCC